MKFIRPLLFLTLVSALVSFSHPGKDIVDDVLKYTNQFRKSRSLPALVIREDINAIAQKHSEDMAKGRVRFGHGGFAKRQSQVQKNIKDASRFAENVAYGATDGKEVVNEWKNSPGHRKNLLGSYRYIGIGVARDKRGTLYYTQVFVD